MKLFSFSKLKKFSSYFIELIIVVLGVSIAFQLNVWNDERKSRSIEDQLIENFANENRFNQQESDSSLIFKKQSIAAGLRFIELLSDHNTEIDSLRLYAIQLYQISWPGFTTTHLENYLNYTTGISPLRDELLNLQSLTESIDELGVKYVEQKQTKYFDYLSDVIDMNNNLEIVNLNKLQSVQFRNNLMIIIGYEQSMAEVLAEINTSQEKLDSLLLVRDH